jgi:putative glutamine amidotransferase
MKPIILITSDYIGGEEAEKQGLTRTKDQDLNVCNWDYIDAVQLSGGIPLVAPNMDVDEKSIEEIISIADGILFSGGGDVNPEYYNEKVKFDNVSFDQRRDCFEMSLITKVLDMNIPVLGICRGMQLINVAAGGNLYQDIKEQYETVISHSIPDSRKWDIVHEIELVKGTKLYGVYDSKIRGVNSFHHQAVKSLAPSLKASAYSEDGLVESFELESTRFLIGVQWHPEKMFEKYPEELKLFRSFVAAAEKYRKRSS